LALGLFKRTRIRTGHAQEIVTLAHISNRAKGGSGGITNLGATLGNGIV
jgi:hypothetical protein